MPTPDKIDQLYDALKADGAVSKSRENFRSYMLASGEQGYRNRKQLYDALKADGAVESATYEEFRDRLGLHAVKPQQSVAKPSSTPSVQQPKPQDDVPGAPLAHDAVSGEDARGLEKTAEDAGTASGNTSGVTPAPGAQNAGGYKPSPSFLFNLHNSVNSYNEGSRRRKEQVHRAVGAMTPAGRQQAKAGKMAAQMAGTPSRVMGLTPPVPKDDMAVRAEAKQQKLPTRGATPYDVVVEDGERKTRWLLPDGRLTTDLLEADRSEYAAVQGRLNEAFRQRMRSGGLDPDSSDDVQTQAMRDLFSRHDADDAAAKAWEAAEARTAESLRQTESNPFLTALPQAEVARAIEARSADMTHHDLQRMADEAWDMLGKERQDAIIDDLATALGKGRPGVDEQEVMATAAKIARAQSDRAMVDYAIKMNAPQSATEFFIRKAVGTNAISSLIDAASRVQAGTRGDMLARDEAESEYERQGHRVAGIGGTVTGFMFDPLMLVSGGVGGSAVKGASWLAGRYAMLNALGRGATEAVAERFGAAAVRKGMETLGGRLAAGAVGGAANFATFDGLGEGLEQLRMGGYRDPETGEVGGYSMGAIGDRAAHGLAMGAATGVVAPLMGNMSDKLVRATESTVGKMGIRIGQLGVSTVTEGTIFATPELIATASNFNEQIKSLSDVTSPNYIADVEEREKKIAELRDKRGDAMMDTWTQNLGMIAGFKAGHALKSAPDRIAELSHSKGESRRKWLEGFETRLRMALDGRHRDLALSQEEREELERNGHADLLNIVDDYQWLSDAERRRKARVDEIRRTSGYDEETAKKIADAESPLPFTEFTSLMTDNKVSASARAKMYYYLTGNKLPTPTILGYNFVEHKDADGNIVGYTVQSVGAIGVITSRNFTSKQRAEVERNAIMRQAELNSIDIGERHVSDVYDEKRTQEACRRVSSETGAPVSILLDIVKNGPRNDVEQKWAERIFEVHKSLGDDGFDALKGMVRNDSDIFVDGGGEHVEGVSEMRTAVGNEFGVDVDKAIRKEPNRRSEKEQQAIEEYVNRLFADIKTKEDAARNSEPRDLNSPSAPSEIAGLLGMGDDDAPGSQMSDAQRRGYDADSQGRRDIAIALADPNNAGNADLQEAWSGVVQRINEEAAYNAAIDREEAKQMRHTDGSIHPATLKEADDNGNPQWVYIVDGHVNMMPDGSSVDPATSDKSIVIYNPATGERTMIDPTSSTGLSRLGEVISWDDREAQIESARQQYVQAMIDDAQGKIFVAPGQQLVLPNGEEAVVVATDADGENITVALGDGTQATVQRSELQRVADEAALADYRQRHGITEEPATQQPEASMPAQPQADGRVAGAPADYTADMELTIRDEDGSEKPAMVMGRVRYENGSFVPDANGNIIEYFMDGEVKHDHVDNLNGKVVSHVPLGGEDARGVQRTGEDERGSGSLVSDGAGGEDAQGNRLNSDGSLYVEQVTSVDEITDADFDEPTRSIELPNVPKNVRDAIGAGDKPVVIKRNIFSKNNIAHPDLSAEESRQILRTTIYSPAIVGQSQPITRPTYWVAIESVDGKSVSVLEVDNNKDNVEIVGWHKIDKKGLEKLKRQAAREDGQLLIQTSSEAAAALSTLPSNSSSAGKVTENTDTVQEKGIENVPMPVDDKGKKDYRRAGAERTERHIYDELGLSEAAADKVVANNVKAAAEALKKARKAAEKVGGNITDPDEMVIAERKAREAIEDAEATKAFWEEVQAHRAAAINAERERVAAEQAERDRIAHEQAVADEAARQAEVLAQREEQAQRGAHAVHPAIREKWEAAPKIEGFESEIPLHDGTTVKGRYMLVESGSSTPSHNAAMDFARSEGFPVDENGNTINDRDYERDRDAQDVTREMGRTFDSRAIQDTPVVSRDGVVLSGNGRTMAGELAARDNTDGAYLDHLTRFGRQYGFTPEQVSSMQHPRLVFVTDEDMPYTTETFAKFNAQQMKSQDRTETAVKLGKTVDDNTFGRIVGDINRFDTLSQFYNDPKASVDAINDLRRSGVINPMQYAEMFDGKKVSVIGRQMLENVLLGKAFESNPDALRELAKYPQLRQSVVAALAEISNNKRLGDYSLEHELSEAIHLAYTALEKGRKQGDVVSNIARQLNLFPFDLERGSVVDYTNASILMLADVLNSTEVNKLRNVLALYNDRAGTASNGNLTLDFDADEAGSGFIESKSQIIKDVLNLIENGERKEKQRAIDEARERRKDAAEAEQGDSGTEQDGTVERSDSGEQPAGGNPDVGGRGTDDAASEELEKEVEPSVGPFGEIYTQFQGKPKEAITFLLAKRSGEAIGALHHKDIGSIDLVWGEEGTGHSDGYGLAKLAKYHPEVLFDLQDILDDMVVVKRSANRVQLESDKYKASVRLTWNEKKKTWLLTMFEKKNSALDNTTDTGKTLSSNGNDTATPESTVVSVGKGSENSETGKEKTEKVAESKASTVIAEAEQEVNTEPTDAQKEAGNYKKGHIKLDGFDISIEQPKGSTRSGRDASGKEWSVTMQNTYGYIRGTEGVDGDHIDVFLSDNMDEWNGTVYVIDQVKADGSFDEHKVMYGFNSAEEAAAAYNSNYSEGWQGLGTITGVSKEEFKKWIGSSHRKTKPFADYKKVKTDEGQSKPFVSEDTEETPTNLDEMRAAHPDALFLVRGQKLYKAYGEDAKKLGEILGVEVKPDKKYGFVASFDHGDFDTNLPKIVRAGLRVAITESSSLKGDKPASGKKETTKAADIAAEQTPASGEGKSGYTVEPAQYTTKRGKVLNMVLVKFGRELTTDEKQALTKLAKEKRGWWDKEKGGFMMRDEATAKQLGDMLGDEEAVKDNQPLSLADVQAVNDAAAVQAVDEAIKVEEKPQSTPQYDYDREDEVYDQVLAGLRETLNNANGNAIPNIKAIEKKIRELRKSITNVDNGLATAGEDTIGKAYETLATLTGRMKAYEKFLAELRKKMSETEREGVDYRGGKDVTPQDFLDEFGFRGVEFGNWVPQGERQMYLNKTYDAIKDFCAIVGISEKAFSLGGRLGLAFGARGKSRAMAHYEPAKEVINLTRMSGAGSLAHEWFHAVDNYLAKQKTGNMSDMATVTHDVVREELSRVFKEMYDAMRSMDYHRRSRNAGEYWGRTEEEFARLFANYIYNKLASKEATSPVLVRKDVLLDYVDEQTKSRWPYPSAEESAKMEPYFDKLFKTIQEKTDENGHVVLFQRVAGSSIGKEASEREVELRDAIVEVMRQSGMPVVIDAEGQRVLDAAKRAEELLNEMKNGSNRTPIDIVKDYVLQSFQAASKGEAKGQRIPIATLTTEGKAFLEQLAGIKMKDNVDFVLNASELRHIYNNHYGENEKDKGNNIPLTDEDIRSLVDVINNPDKVVYAKDAHDGRHIFYFFKQNPNGTYNLAEVYGDKRGNLTAKSYFNTKRTISQRVNDLKKSQTLTSVTEGASSSSGAKIPQLFETTKDKIREMRVWHGSGAEFDAFDHSHMGEGEGAQAYGWGTYVTQVEGIGRAYARSSGGRRVFYDGRAVDPHSRGTLAEHCYAAVARRVLDGKMTAGEYIADRLANFDMQLVRLRESGKEQFIADTEKLRDVFASMDADRFELVEGPAVLYEVEIPDNDGGNYLQYDKQMGAQGDALERIDNELTARGWHRSEQNDVQVQNQIVRFEKDGKDIILRPVQQGRDLYAELENGLGSDKAASEFLSECGFVGIEYPTNYRSGGNMRGEKNYVIFNEADAKILNKTQFFRTAEGEVYGFVKDGVIYLDPKLADAETAIHEYGHLWGEALRAKNPAAWARLRGEMEADAELMAYVKSLYPELEGDALIDEVFQRYAGKRGAERLRAERDRMLGQADGILGKAGVVALFDKLRRLLERFWRMSRDLFAGVVDGLDRLSGADFADMMLADLLGGFNPNAAGARGEGLVAETGVADPFYSNAARAEEAAIERKAKADGSWLTAPNGERSRLAPRQWLQTRTKAFKKWFGDSKIVDENGEPLVVYRGDRPGRYVMDSAQGSFFSDREIIADGYAGKEGQTYAVYLDIKNPAYMDNEADYNRLRNEISDMLYDFYDMDESELDNDERWQSLREFYLNFRNNEGSSVRDFFNDFLPEASEDMSHEELLENMGRALRDLFQFSYREADYRDMDIAVPFLRVLGYDGIIRVYDKNGDAAGKEYITFDPAQVKSATDNNGDFSRSNPDIRYAVSEDSRGRERTREESRGKKADGVATRREVELRDALVEVMRQAGLAVVVDDAEGQRVLDAAKRAADVLDEMKRKSAQETALPEGETSFKGTVISSADGAKVLQNLETLIKNAEKLDAAGQRNFLGEVAKALGARRYGSGSQYATFETVNGEVVTIRLADHNAHVSGFDNAGRDNGISIVISRKPNNGVLDDGDAHVVEFFYKDKDLRKAEGSPYAAIARSIGQALYSGEYRDTTGLAQREEVNAENVIREMRVWHGTAADFEAFDHSHMGEGEGAQAYGWGTYVTMVDGIARSYAMQDARKRPSYYWKGQKIDTESVNPLRMAYDVVEREGSIKKALALVERFLENPDAHEGWAAVRDILKQSRKSDFTSKQTRYLYEVEIPDSRADFEEDNARYNEELDAFGRGELKGVAIHFGQAGGILRALGFGSGRGMMMSVRKFKEHLDKHGLTLDDVRDLPKALNKPLMVYEWGTQHKSTIVVTELTTADGRKITAAVKLHKDFTGDGSTIVVDEIASVHGKDAERMLSELLDEQERKVHGGVENILKYVKDKEKVLDWLGMYPPKGSISLSDQELSLAKIIKDFENPSDAVENYGDYIPYDEPLSGEHGERVLQAMNKLLAETQAERAKTQKEMREMRDPVQQKYGDDWLSHLSGDEQYHFNELIEKQYALQQREAHLSSAINHMGYGDKFSVIQGQLEMALGGRATSEFLHDCGFVGIEYPAQYRSGGRDDGAKNYVIFNEADAKILNKTQFFRTAEGEVYGFVKDGVIYLDPKLADAETAIHEYGHLWGEALRAKNPAAWARLRGEMEADAELMAYVKSLYPELEGDALIDEVFQRYAGKRGAERLRAERDRMLGQADGILGKAGVVALFDKLRRLLERFWRMSRDLFAGVVDGLDRLSGADFADMMLADLLGGFNPNAAGARGEGLVAETGVADPFYSNAARAVENIKQNKAKAEQWKAMLTKAGGIKAGEDKWMGLTQWLDEHKGETLTKEQVLEFIAENGVKMVEREYIEAPYSFESLKREYDQWLHDEGFDYAQEQLLERFGDDADLAFDDLGGELVIANEEAAAALLGSEDIINSTRLDYTTEGLDNKREIAFVVPGVEPYQEGDEVHFGPENEGRAVMWVRFGETTDEDGNRVLVIDEIQSNRHQDAREKGYEDPALTERLKQIQQEIDAATKEFGDFNDTLRQKYGVSTNYTKIEKTREEWGWNHRLVPDEDVLTKEEVQKWKEGDEKIKALRDVKEKLLVDRMGQEGVPAAPFEKNWHEVAMKRMLRLAAEEGFDKVAWTTGEQQAERYGIGDAVKGVYYGDWESTGDSEVKRVEIPFKDSAFGPWLEVDRSGKIVQSLADGIQFVGHNLSELLGKEIANKVLTDGAGSISGDGLRIGGEGMKGFYDQMLPRFMDKYGKKWGVKTGEVRLSTPGGEVMHSVDVTDAMRRSVLVEGQPLFQKAEDSRGRQRTGEDVRYRVEGDDGAGGVDARDVAQSMDDNNGTEVVRFIDFLRRGRLEQGESRYFHVGETGDILNEHGISGKISIGTSAVNSHHNEDADHLDENDWVEVIEKINEPVAITEYSDRGNSYRIYTIVEKNGKNICVGVDVNSVGRDVNITNIRTAFARDIANALNERLVYPHSRTELETAIRELSLRHNREVYPEQPYDAANIQNNSDIARENGENVTEDTAKYRIREDEPPTKTGIGYKVFVLKDGKLYPPMVANPNGEATPVGVWLDADAAPVAGVTKTGRQQVKAGGKGTQGGSGKLAYRPGWHLGEIPYALQFNRMNPETGQRELFPANFVWAEVEYANDVDYQEEAMSYGMNASGKFQHSLAGLPRLPENGSYRYRTNPDPNTDPWIITGAMKVNRILKPSEVDAMVEAAGREPQQRQAGAITDEQVEALNANVKRTMQEDRDMMHERAISLGEKLGVKVRLVESRSELPSNWSDKQKRRRKGWFDPRTGEVVIVVPNNNNVADVEATVLHEIVGHKGLRELFGKDFDTFLDNVFNNVDAETRSKIVARMHDNGWNVRKATEEYLASLAESTDFENEVSRSAWEKIKDLFMELLRKAGIMLSRPLTDADLRYILWRSYQRRVEQGAMGVAADVVMRERLGVDGEGAAERDEMMFRDDDFSVRDRAVARDEYERMVSSGSYQFQEAVQDSMLGLKRLYQSILGKETRIEDIAGNENAYLAENRMSSVNAAEQHEYYIRYMKPLLEAISKIAGKNKTERERLSDYMMAKHGLERNLVLAERDAREAEAAGGDYNDAYASCRERDYAGLTALTGEADVAAAEAAAQQIVDDYERAHDTTDLWQRVNDATSATLEKIYRSGLLSVERYQQIQQMFENYIPLQGWDETTSDEVYGYLTSKYGPLTGSPIKRAQGRSSKADDPIATIALMADTAIRQGNRNKMKQTFHNFVLNHPSDLVSVNSLWLQYNAAMDEWEPVFADIEPTDTAADVERKVEAFEARMEQLAEDEPDKYKRGRDAQSIPYKVVRDNMREHQVLVKRGGETYVLTINGNPRAAQALNGLTNPDVEVTGFVGSFLRGVQTLNRNLSAFYTTRNPDFIMSNFFRDMLYSNCMTWVKESPRYALRFHCNFGRVNPIRLRGLLAKWEKGTLDDSNYIERNFKLFMQNGGETGYTNVRDIEGHKRTIIRELKRMKGNIAKAAWRLLGVQFDLLNRSAENCARFAAFLTSRELGRSIERSVYDAKEVSVNFNKKGAGDKMLNSVGQTKLGKFGSYVSGGGRLLYVFWNAGVQGSTNFMRQAKHHPFKFTAGAASMFVLGAVIPILAKAMGGDDDDDENAYYNLPEYVRRSNIIINAGDQWIAIPLPIEFRALYGLGELSTGVVSGNERYSGSELAYNIGSQVSQIMPLDMLEGGGGLNPFIPSAAKPFVEAYWLNKNWTGLPIYKDTPWNKDDPEWTKAYKSANTYLVSGAQWLNELSGGDEYRKGWIDINPSKVEYLLSGMFGGVFTTTDKLVKMGETAIGSRDFDWRNMLIANRVVKTGDERTANRKLTNEYYKYKDSYEDTKRLLKKYGEKAESDEAYRSRLESLMQSDDYLIYEVFDNYQPLFDVLYDAKKGADENTVKTIENEERVLRREMIDLLHEIEDDKHPDYNQRVDAMLKREFSGGGLTQQKAGSVIAKRMGGKDTYGSPDTEYGEIYLQKRDYFDLAEDVLLQSEWKKAKDSGDTERASAIDKARKELTTIKKGKHTKSANIPGLGEGDDDKVIEQLRTRRREILKEFGITPQQTNR